MIKRGLAAILWIYAAWTGTSAIVYLGLAPSWVVPVGTLLIGASIAAALFWPRRKQRVLLADLPRRPDIGAQQPSSATPATQPE